MSETSVAFVSNRYISRVYTFSYTLYSVFFSFFFHFWLKNWFTFCDLPLNLNQKWKAIQKVYFNGITNTITRILNERRVWEALHMYSNQKHYQNYRFFVHFIYSVKQSLHFPESNRNFANPCLKSSEEHSS